MGDTPERVHRHILRELRQSARAGSICVVAPALFNLIALGDNWAMAGEALKDDADLASDLVIWTLCAVSLAINGTFGLFTARSLVWMTGRWTARLF